jgi:hypothetical protein
MEVGVRRYASAAGPPRKFPGTHCTGGGSEWTVWKTGNLLPTPRFDPRTIQPVVSRYTDYAIPALFISGIPLQNLIENAPLVGVVKHTNEQTGVCAPPIVLALCDVLE